MHAAEFPEANLLLCFSASGYWSIAKMLKVRARTPVPLSAGAGMPLWHHPAF